MQKLMALPFIAMTFLSWGLYGPLLHQGQHGMGDGVRPSSLRPFICVGISYFLIAVVVPLAMLWAKGEKGKWTIQGAFWSFAAGCAGAFGALGITLAFKFRGSPLFVMPLVFGLAPVMNTFVTMWMMKSLRQASAIFFAGVLMVAVGAAGVMFFKPSAKPHAAEAVAVQTQAEGQTEVAATPSDVPLFPLAGLVMVPLSIALTGVCWGSYGAVLHKGQMKMGGSRLRPFLCVGLAYFVIAVLVPLPLLEVFREPGGWEFWGTVWSLAGGAAGALGALGIVLAFNYGGKPIYVMPLVFGGAPVVNTLTTTLAEGTLGQISVMFFLSTALVIAGAVTVLVFAPRPGQPSAKKKADRPPKTKSRDKPEKKSTASPREESPRNPLLSTAAQQPRPAQDVNTIPLEQDESYDPSLEETFDSEETIDRESL
jgi:hypothetical protein